MGGVLGLKAFAVAIIGGLTSGMGIIVGGIILGVAGTTTGFYFRRATRTCPAWCCCCWCWLQARRSCSATAIKKV
jgi:branched-chain amino acid transport system permease protein